MALGSDTAASESQSENDVKQSGSNLLYSVINTFRRPTVESNTSTSSKKSSSTGNSSVAAKEEDFELEDDYDESEDDYPHYGSNSASTLLFSFSSLLLIIGALVGQC